MQYSIRLQKQTDRRKRRKFQKTLPPEILCHRCYHCWRRIGFKHPSETCCCPDGKMNSSTYCSSKPELPSKGLEGWETWDFPLFSCSTICLPFSFFCSLFVFFSINICNMYIYLQYIYLLFYYWYYYYIINIILLILFIYVYIYVYMYIYLHIL